MQDQSPAPPRKHLCDVAQAPQQVENGKKEFDLESLWAALQNTSLVDAGFWSSCCGSTQLSRALKDYKDLAQSLCDMGRSVLAKEPAQGKVTASQLKALSDALPKKMAAWLPAQLSQHVQDTCLHTVQAQLSVLSTAGSESVAKLVGGLREPSSAKGFAAEHKAKILAQFPKTDPLKPLVASFAEAGGLRGRRLQVSHVHVNHVICELHEMPSFVVCNAFRVCPP